MPLITPLTLVAQASNGFGETETSSPEWTDLRAALGGTLYGQITNGATGPEQPCWVYVDYCVDPTAGSPKIVEGVHRMQASAANNAVSVFRFQIRPGAPHVRVRFAGNTGQAVTVEAYFGRVDKA